MSANPLHEAELRALDRLGWTARDVFNATLHYGDVGTVADVEKHLATGDHLAPAKKALVAAALWDAELDRAEAQRQPAGRDLVQADQLSGRPRQPPLTQAPSVTARDAMATDPAADRGACEEFLAMAAHELRGPAMVLAYAGDAILHLVEGDELDPKVMELLQMVARTGRRMQKLTTDLLSSAYLERGDLPARTERLPLLPIIRWAVDASGSAGSPVEVDCDAQVVARIDPDRFEQILTNLVSNAIAHASPPVVVTVRSLEHAEAVTVSVRDAGPGIALEDRQHAFERFSPLASRTATSSGLGLAISKGLAHSMGGDLTYRHIGPGSLFELTLPDGRDDSA